MCAVKTRHGGGAPPHITRPKCGGEPGTAPGGCARAVFVQWRPLDRAASPGLGQYRSSRFGFVSPFRDVRTRSPLAHDPRALSLSDGDDYNAVAGGRPSLSPFRPSVCVCACVYGMDTGSGGVGGDVILSYLIWKMARGGSFNYMKTESIRNRTPRANARTQKNNRLG